ncbi:MAG: sulfotransferase domain-containing protein [Sphingobacteriales bacterium]|nr:sulfotransferase domain-containing protein [Sphingobacteriales bacterium]
MWNIFSEIFIKKQHLLLSGMGRSGTTWVGQVLNAQKQYDEIFEPFCKDKIPSIKSYDFFTYMTAETQNAPLYECTKKY